MYDLKLISRDVSERFFNNEEYDKLSDYLAENYDYILKSINDENYIIEFEQFTLFEELIFDGNVVGFISFEEFSAAPNNLSINECYVLPEFRGNDIFLRRYFYLINDLNHTFYLKKPNKTFINLLLKNNLAISISANLVYSYNKFCFDIEDNYQNPKIKRFYNKEYETKFPYLADVYDENLKAVMGLDPGCNFAKYSDVFIISNPRKYDFKKYKPRKKLKKVTEGYLDDVYIKFENNESKIMKFREDVEEAIEDVFNVEKVLGTSQKLSDDFLKILDSFELSDETGFKILNHIETKLDEGEINLKSYMSRLGFLLNHINFLDKKLDEHSENCPFCEYDDNLIFYNYCEVCGQKLRDIPFDEMMSQIGELCEGREDLLESLPENFDDFNIDEFMGKVAVGDNDELKEMKEVYNERLLSYEFEDFLKYYNDYGKDIDIEILADSFLDYHLENALGTNKEYDEYLTYLINYMFDYLDMKKYDESLIKWIQLVILASNNSLDESGSIVENNPHAFDIMYFLDCFLSNCVDFDYEESFNKAVETFKIPKYNNNHEEIFEALPEYLDIF